MNKTLYPRLAFSNIKKNAKTYVPYIITCITTVAMYFVLLSLTFNEDIEKVAGMTFKSILMFGCVVMGLFSLVFIFYTNSFLVKRRTKEFGLFNILGMEKKHISILMFFENLFVAIGSIVTGILAGALLNKLMFLLLLKILNFDIKMEFEFSINALEKTVLLFVIIFAVVLLNTIRLIHLSNPIELINGGKAGEKEPKNKWLLTILGVITLGSGYYISVTTKSPFAAINLFFVAVILVIIGTYFLFTSGSITLLKVLRKNKNYYYKTNHFVSLSTMMYRMKQNAVGLANICILSTAVLVILTTTLSLYAGSEDIIRQRYPRNISIYLKNDLKESEKKLEEICTNTLNKHNLKEENLLNYKVNSILTSLSGDVFTISDGLNPMSSMSSSTNVLNIILLDDYNRLMETNLKLNDDEILLKSNRQKYNKDNLSIGELQFKVKENLKECIFNGEDSAMAFDSHYIVVKDDKIFNKILSLSGSKDLYYFYGFDLKDKQITVYDDINNLVSSTFKDGSYAECSEIEKNDFYSIYGGLFFIGIFLGALFIMATILIMYYKQISEGYEDKERYAIMQKVGMDKNEVKSTIRSQVLTVFFAPLVFAMIHIGFAFPTITRMLKIFNFTNIKLFVICTLIIILAFGICYGIVYLITSKVYYKIVK